MTALDHATRLAMDSATKDAIEFCTELCIPFEGFHSAPYLDPVGYPTRGYGELLSRKFMDAEARKDKQAVLAFLSQWDSVTEPEARENLAKALVKFQATVHRLIYAEMSAPQEGAVIDFTYNCGGANLQASTLRRVINRGDYESAPYQFKRWVYARGVYLRGLARRRQAEADLWMTG